METVTSSVSSALSSLGLNFGQFALSNLVSAVVILIVGLILTKILLKVFSGILEHSRLDPILYAFLRGMARIVLYILVAIVCMSALGVNTSSLVALLSVAGLAVSLALQNSLSNLAGGIMLLMTKPVTVGDFVEIAGQSGTVLEVGLVYTKVNTLDNKRISIPNSTIAAANIINYSTEGRRRVDLKFTASYDSPVETAKKALREAIDGQEKVLKDPEAFVRVSAYLSSSIEYTVRIWCRTEDYWDVYYDTLEAVEIAFRRNGVEMSYDHLNVHMIPAAPATTPAPCPDTPARA